MKKIKCATENTESTDKTLVMGIVIARREARHGNDNKISVLSVYSVALLDPYLTNPPAGGSNQNPRQRRAGHPSARRISQDHAQSLDAAMGGT